MVKAEFNTGVSVEDLLWGGPWEYVAEDLTRGVADDGFERQANVQEVSIKDIFDW